MKADESKLEDIVEKFVKHGIDRKIVLEEVLSDIPNLRKRIEMAHNIFIESLKKSEFYPRLLDKRDDEGEKEAEKRQRKERLRIFSMSPKEFMEDFNEKLDNFVENRDECSEKIDEYNGIVKKLEAEKKGKKATKHEIEKYKKLIEKYSGKLKRYDEILTHSERKIQDSDLPAIGALLGKRSLSILCESYAEAQESLNKKKLKYAKLSKGRKRAQSLSEAETSTSSQGKDVIGDLGENDESSLARGVKHKSARSRKEKRAKARVNGEETSSYQKPKRRRR